MAGGTGARACAHTPAQGAAGRSQPRSKAGQSSLPRSASQPGSSAQRAGTQRERARRIVPSAIGVAAAGWVTTAAAGLSSGGAGSSGGALEHAASNPRIAAGTQARRRFRAGRTFDMWILFLEAFGAVLLLVLIVWWTMFHGRSKGERERDRDA
jgi:hypothetical protein